MKPSKTVLVKLLSAGLLAGSCALAVQAADVIKADNADDLNLGTSWVLGSPPTSADVGVWNNTVTFNTTSSLGADTNWAGVKIVDPGGPITINAGNMLTLGASGIDMSGASQDLFLNNSNTIGASQSWNVPSDRTLSVATPLTGPTASVLTKSGAGTLTIDATLNGTFSGNLSIDGGLLHLNSANVNNNSAAGTGFITNNGAVLQGANRIIGNALQFNGTCILDLNNTSQVLDGAWMGSGTVIVSNLLSGSTLTAGGNGNSGGTWGSFTGTVLLNDSGGTLRFNNGGGNNNVGNANVTIDLGSSTGILFSRNRNGPVTIGELRGGPDTTIRQGASSSGTSTYTIGAKGTSTTFAGQIIDGGTTAAGLVALTKVGAGTLTLTGTNTYLGGTTVSAGVLQIGDGGVSGLIGLGPVTINGGTSVVLNRADDLSLTNQLSGSGIFLKTNSNVLTYFGTNNSSGVTLHVGSGTLDMGEGAQVLGRILLNPGTLLSVTGAPSFVLNGVLAGNGTAASNLVAAAGSTLSPGSAAGLAGVLTFEGGLTLQGGGTFVADLSNDPDTASANDRIDVIGDLTPGGVTTISVNTLTTLTNRPYTLFTYTGGFSGTTNDFAISGAFGSISNPPGSITFTPIILRPGTNLTWVGDGAANSWDNLASSNWLSGSTLFTFVPGDNVRFDNTGSTNPTVNLVGDVAPKSVVVDASSDYTFTGTGRIVGNTDLAKSNSAALTIVTTNNAYTGPTVVAGGTLGISTVALGGADSSIGRSSASSTNLVLIDSALRYDGLTAATDRGATLNGANDIINVVTSTENLTLGGTITGTAGLSKNGAGTLTLSVANSYAGGTVISNGVLALGSNNANSSGSLSGLGPTNNAVTFYGGTLELFGYNGGTGNNYNTLRNPLIVPAGQTGTLRMFPRGPSNSGASSGLQSSLTGDGTLNLVVNYVRDNLSGDWSTFTGLINVTPRNASGDEMRINNNFGYANASIFLNDNVNLDRADTANTINDIGELGGTAVATLAAGNGSGANTTWRVGFKNTTATFAGVIAADNNIVKVGTGKWILTGPNSYTGSTTVSNGVLALGDGVTDGSIDFSSFINVGSGTFLDVSGRSDQTLLLGFQELRGRGTVLGSVNANGIGTVAPGDGPNGDTGTLTVTNNVFLTGTAWMKLNRDNIPNSDRLVSTLGTINLGGTLVVTNVGPRLHMGDTFDLFDGALAGGFTTVSLANYYTWNTNNLTVDGTISVSGVLPGPSLGEIVIDNGNVILTATNGAPDGMFILLTSTNVALPLTSWTPVSTNNFDSTGVINPPIVLTTDPEATQQFYLIEAF